MTAEQRIEIIRECLKCELEPGVLEVIDEGHKHIGHVGAQTGRGHFYVTIASPKFKGKSTLECHRMVYDALGTLMQTEIHALRINIAARTGAKERR